MNALIAAILLHIMFYFQILRYVKRLLDAV